MNVYYFPLECLCYALVKIGVNSYKIVSSLFKHIHQIIVLFDFSRTIEYGLFFRKLNYI